MQGSWQVDSGERRSLVHRIIDTIKELETNLTITKVNKARKRKNAIRDFRKLCKNYIIKDINFKLILCFTLNSTTLIIYS